MLALMLEYSELIQDLGNTVTILSVRAVAALHSHRVLTEVLIISAGLWALCIFSG
jgi:hypothetical protein